MSKYYVGQPVRIVRDDSNTTPQVVGVETIVTSTEQEFSVFKLGKISGYRVALRPDPPWEYYVFKEDELEPILPISVLTQIEEEERTLEPA